MIALYRCGRQAEAMRVFQATRQALDDELGQLPGAELQETHRAILRHSVALVSPTGVTRTRADHLDHIVRAALASQLVPVLGPGLGGSAPAPDHRAAAKHLSQHFGCPREYAGTLARVGQWVAVTHGIGPLYDELHALYAQAFAPGPGAPNARGAAAAPPCARPPVPAGADIGLRPNARAAPSRTRARSTTSSRSSRSGATGGSSCTSAPTAPCG